MTTTSPDKTSATPVPTQTLIESDTQAVMDYVMAHLGRPPKLARVDVRQLWAGAYRVNVYTRDHAGPFATMTMSDSFFVTAGQGAYQSEPAIEQKYDRAAN